MNQETREKIKNILQNLINKQLSFSENLLNANQYDFFKSACELELNKAFFEIQKLEEK